ncbi:MAG: hypothetical protein IT384_24015 [Deltaproteobacteria bacterium]|nr:hypothetical protein [Deltaproteobacteria bacterium]
MPSRSGLVVPEPCGLVPSRALGPFNIVAHVATGRRTDAWLAQRDGAEGVWLLRELKPGQDPHSFVQDVERSVAFGGAPELEAFAPLRAACARPVVGESLATILDAVISRRVALPIAQAITIAMGVAQALGRATPEFHGDLVPHHVLVGYDGSVFLIDPAGAERAPERARAPDREGYRSPEHVSGAPLGPASDVFVLGALLFELSTASRLFGGAAAPADTAIRSGTYPRPRAIGGDHYPIELQVILRKMLRREENARFSDGAAALEGLRLASPLSPEERRARLAHWMRSSFADRYRAWADVLRSLGAPLSEDADVDLDAEPTEGVGLSRAARVAHAAPKSDARTALSSGAEPFVPEHARSREATVVDARFQAGHPDADDLLAPRALSRETTVVTAPPDDAREITHVEHLPEGAEGLSTSSPDLPFELAEADLLPIDSVPPPSSEETPRESLPPWQAHVSRDADARALRALLEADTLDGGSADPSEDATPLPALHLFDTGIPRPAVSPVSTLNLAADLLDDPLGGDFVTGEVINTERSSTPNGEAALDPIPKGALHADSEAETAPPLIPEPRKMRPRAESHGEVAPARAAPTPTAELRGLPAPRPAAPTRDATMIIRQRVIPRDAVKHEVELSLPLDDLAPLETTDHAVTVETPPPAEEELELESLVVPVGEIEVRVDRSGRGRKRRVLIAALALLGGLALWAVGRAWLGASSPPPTPVRPAGAPDPLPQEQPLEPPTPTPTPATATTASARTATRAGSDAEAPSAPAEIAPAPAEIAPAPAPAPALGEPGKPGEPAPDPEPDPDPVPPAPPPTREAKSPPPKRPSPPRRSAPVESGGVRIRAFPKSAQIRVDGVLTPNGARVEPSDIERTVEVSADGYETYEATLAPGRSAPLDIVLRRTADPEPAE